MRLFYLSLLAPSLILSACDAPQSTQSNPIAVEVIKPSTAPAASRAPSFASPKLTRRMPLKYMWRWRSAPRPSLDQAHRHEVSIDEVGTFRLSTSGRDGLRLERIQGEGAWRDLRVASPMMSEGALSAYEHRTLLLAVYARTKAGGELIGVSVKDGKILWRQPLKGLGPVNHSQYMNEVQLYVEQGRVIVHGMESGGCYTEVRSASDGALIDSERVDCELVKPPAQWPLPSKEEPKATTLLEIDERTSVLLEGLKLDEFQEMVIRSDPKKRLDVKKFMITYKFQPHEWSFSRNTTYASPDQATHGRLAADQDYIYVALAHHRVPGSQVIAISRHDMKEVWSASTRGVGLIERPEHSNLLQTMTVTSRGVELYAVESGGSYLEVLDPKTGRTLINHRYDTR